MRGEVIKASRHPGIYFPGARQLKELAELVRVEPDPMTLEANVQLHVVTLHDDERLLALGALHLR